MHNIINLVGTICPILVKNTLDAYTTTCLRGQQHSIISVENCMPGSEDCSSPTFHQKSLFWQCPSENLALTIVSSVLVLATGSSSSRQAFENLLNNIVF